MAQSEGIPNAGTLDYKWHSLSGAPNMGNLDYKQHSLGLVLAQAYLNIRFSFMVHPG